jgi:hypothetical protein
MEFRMNDLAAPRRALRSVVTIALALAGARCGDLDTFLPASQPGRPSGVLDGTVVYHGALPCTERGHIVGAAVVLIFDTKKLPPPDGTGSGAASLATADGDELFASVRGRLTFRADGSRWCPADDAAWVTVSAPWIAAPMDPGVYQLRGFFDRDGDFDPIFSIANLPTAGDVAGGAIENATEALGGARPIYREIALGTLRTDGSRVIPPDGARIGSIVVTLALPLPLERPIFYPKRVTDETAVKNTNPRAVTMPSDFQLAVAGGVDPSAIERSFIRLTLGAGVDPSEADVASRSPLGLPTKSPAPFFFVNWQDVNGDGVLSINDDHIADSNLLPSLFPLAVFSRLSAGSDLVRASDPQILLQGITLYQSVAGTVFSKSTLAEQVNELVVALRPAAVCLPDDPSRTGALVVTHERDGAGSPIVAEEGLMKAALKAQFKRPFELVYGCLPEGRYAMNLIYGTGQAWTLPNEAGVCAATEPASMDGTQCVEPTKGTKVTRARLASQNAVLTIGPPTDASSCKALPAACLAATKAR